MPAGTLQEVNNKLDTWAAKKGPTFSTNKTVKMIFKKRKKVKPIEITIRNQIVLYNESSQVLGITLDSKLNWKVHIHRVRVRAEAKSIGRRKKW